MGDVKYKEKLLYLFEIQKKHIISIAEHYGITDLTFENVDLVANEAKITLTVTSKAICTQKSFPGEKFVADKTDSRNTAMIYVERYISALNDDREMHLSEIKKIESVAANYLSKKILTPYTSSYVFPRHSGYVRTCVRCHGEGRVKCGTCHGSGKVVCERCSGTGRIKCSGCDGSGHVRSSNGSTHICSKCNGAGRYACNRCNGSGLEICKTCNGNGEVICSSCKGHGIETCIFSGVYNTTLSVEYPRFDDDELNSFLYENASFDDIFLPEDNNLVFDRCGKYEIVKIIPDIRFRLILKAKDREFVYNCRSIGTSIEHLRGFNIANAFFDTNKINKYTNDIGASLNAFENNELLVKLFKPVFKIANKIEPLIREFVSVESQLTESKSNELNLIKKRNGAYINHYQSDQIERELDANREIVIGLTKSKLDLKNRLLEYPEIKYLSEYFPNFNDLVKLTNSLLDISHYFNIRNKIWISSPLLLAFQAALPYIFQSHKISILLSVILFFLVIYIFRSFRKSSHFKGNIGWYQLLSCSISFVLILFNIYSIYWSTILLLSICVIDFFLAVRGLLWIEKYKNILNVPIKVRQIIASSIIVFSLPVGVLFSGGIDILTINKVSEILSRYPEYEAFYNNWDSFNTNDWILILKKQPQLYNKCPKRILRSFKEDELIELLASQPQLYDKWNISISDSGKFALLERNSKVAEYFTANDWYNLLLYYHKSKNSKYSGSLIFDNCSKWNEFTKDNWLLILRLFPELADKCTKWNEFNNKEWILLLKEEPRLIKKCTTWDKFTKDNWIYLLKEFPELSDKCTKWDSFTADEWYDLLLAHPKFIKKYNELIKSAKGIVLDPSTLISLFKNNPQLIDEFDSWEKFTKNDWIHLLSGLPKLADKCTIWSEFSNRDWISLLDQNPQFATKCDLWEKFTKNDWIHLLSGLPELADKCTIWSEFSNRDWILLLKQNPQFVTKCESWEKFTKYEWLYLLKRFPRLANKCTKWGEFSDKDMILVFIDNPDLIDECLSCDKLTGQDWALLLNEFPGLVAKYTRWDRFDGNEWVSILKKNPGLIDKCASWDKFTKDNWIFLLENFPELADKCTKWDEFNENDWSNLLLHQPHFINRCNKLDKFNKDKWISLLQKHSLFYEKCPFKSELSRFEWYKILMENPDLADKCTVLDGFDSFDWKNLIKAHPQLAEKRNWEKVSIWDQVEIMGVQPKLSDRFTKWDEIRPIEWVYLLTKQPQLGDKCNIWHKFGKQEWYSLLEKQPQFANKLSESMYIELKKHPNINLDAYDK